MFSHQGHEITGLSPPRSNTVLIIICSPNTYMFVLTLWQFIQTGHLEAATSFSVLTNTPTVRPNTGSCRELHRVRGIKNRFRGSNNGRVLLQIKTSTAAASACAQRSTRANAQCQGCLRGQRFVMQASWITIRFIVQQYMSNFPSTAGRFSSRELTQASIIHTTVKMWLFYACSRGKELTVHSGIGQKMIDEDNKRNT